MKRAREEYISFSPAAGSENPAYQFRALAVVVIYLGFPSPSSGSLSSVSRSTKCRVSNGSFQE